MSLVRRKDKTGSLRW